MLHIWSERSNTGRQVDEEHMHLQTVRGECEGLHQNYKHSRNVVWGEVGTVTITSTQQEDVGNLVTRFRSCRTSWESHLLAG